MDWNEETERRVAKGVALFKQGYNCSQSVTLTFADWYGVPEGLMARISASFGGGIGRMRETCGAASGIFMLAGLEEASEKADKEVKARNYAVVQRLADDFRRETGSIVCRDILGLKAEAKKKEIESPRPSERSAEYYKSRPCAYSCETAAAIVAEYLLNIDKQK